MVSVDPMAVGFDGIAPEWTSCVLMVIHIRKSEKHPEGPYDVCETLLPAGGTYEFFAYELVPLIRDVDV